MKRGGFRRVIPWAMVWLRVVLCPVIVFGASRGWQGGSLMLIVLVALIDDIYDGILARRWGTETEALRRADSAADTVFYLGVAVALWLKDSTLLLGAWRWLAALLALELVRHVFDLSKFGRMAAYHSYLAKGWGLVLGMSIMAVLTFDGPRWPIVLSAALGIVANLEGLTMSLMLPRWRNDVKTLAAAWRLRREMLG